MHCKPTNAEPLLTPATTISSFTMHPSTMCIAVPSFMTPYVFPAVPLALMSWICTPPWLPPASRY